MSERTAALDRYFNFTSLQTFAIAPVVSLSRLMGHSRQSVSGRLDCGLVSCVTPERNDRTSFRSLKSDRVARMHL